MAGVLGHRAILALFQIRSKLPRKIDRSFFRGNGRRGMSSSVVETKADKEEHLRKQWYAAAREDRLDFLTAARILSPLLRNLENLAAYLTAQYARHEMRKMEKEREQAKQLALEAAAAEVQASKVADEGKKVVEPSKTSTEESNSFAAQLHKKHSAVKNTEDSVVVIPEKELVALKARLDAMEDKVRSLESVRLDSNPIVTAGTEEHVVKSAPQRASSMEVSKDDQRKPEKRVVGRFLEE